MAKAGYSATTEGVVAAAAAGTAKTVFAIIAPSQFGIDLQEIAVSFDGVTASEKPVLVELVKFTTDGTGTSVTVNQEYGKAITAGFTAKKNYTVEPGGTVTVLRRKQVDPNKGIVWRDWPLGRTPDTAVSEILAIRITVPSGGAAVNVDVDASFERT